MLAVCNYLKRMGEPYTRSFTLIPTKFLTYQMDGFPKYKAIPIKAFSTANNL